MKNMNDKTKRWLTIAGLSIVCVALVIAISFQFKTEKSVDDPITPTTVTDNKINPNIHIGDQTEENEIVIQPNEPTVATTEDTADNTDQPVQNLQPEVNKPAEPTENQKTDKTQKPNGEKVDNVKEESHDSVKKPDTINSSEPQGGERKDGKVYLPGFGWIEDHGGGAEGTFVDGEGDINKQVGTMD